MKNDNNRVGLWIVGVKGSIAGAVVVGLYALQNKLTTTSGIVSESAIFEGIDFVPFESMVVGGCDVRPGKFEEILQKDDSAAYLRQDNQASQSLSEYAQHVERNITNGTVINCGGTIESMASEQFTNGRTLDEIVQDLRGQICAFKVNNGLDEVVVVNLASTEPPIEYQEEHYDIDLFTKSLRENKKELFRASTLYAYAALLARSPYINFTPSNAALPPALIDFAKQNNLPVMGNDGKTGETLVKSCLAPMFTSRNLKILSWEGFNILGNLDGAVLNDPANCASKLKTKDKVLKNILGYEAHSAVHINYVPSLGDQKTAWDFIHFEGFLGAKMSLQFTWQGYDSLLAAPLVLDLVRFAIIAKSRGESGLLPHLAPFFKAPLAVTQFSHFEQHKMLIDYAQTLTKK